MRATLVSVICLCWCGEAGPAEGQPSAPPLLAAAASTVDHLAIEGETKVEPYKLVRLSSSVKAAADVGFLWDVTPDDAADVHEHDEHLVFVGPPGKYSVRLRCIDFKSRKIESARTTVVIGLPGPTPPGPGPGPEPGPGPTPPPPPGPAPDGWEGMTRWICERATAEVRLDAAARKASAKALAGSFRAIAARIRVDDDDPASRDLETAVDIREATAVSNREAAGRHREAWLPVFTSLSEKTKSLGEANKLRSPQHYIDCWIAIADGLERVQ